MANTRINRREVVKAVKEMERPERANFTFRMDKTLMERLKKACKAEGITPTFTIEQLIREFLKD